jgi:putative Holliday junction resolvase
MRLLSLDIGDVWTGVAISDPSGIIATPYTTLSCNNFLADLSQIIEKENIEKIIIGYPQTMRGTNSQQTEKVLATKGLIEQECNIECILVDERWTSQEAARIKKAKTSQDKQKQHAIAAALILTTYLNYHYIPEEESSKRE